MAVLNPPGALPGLARAITNQVLSSRAQYDEDRLQRLFAPGTVGGDDAGSRGMDNTLRAARAIDLISVDKDGVVVAGPEASRRSNGKPFTRAEFRSLLRDLVLDVDRDGDVWGLGEEEARTSGARDLARGLSWFLAQDALGGPMSWASDEKKHSVESLQSDQFRGIPQEDRPIVNDTRWGAFSRWAPALGLAEWVNCNAVSEGLVPLPTVALRDVVGRMEPARFTVKEFLEGVAASLPVVDGGPHRQSMLQVLDEDPDPSTRRGSVDTSLAQGLLILAEEGAIRLDYQADAEARDFGQPGDEERVTHVVVLEVQT